MNFVILLSHYNFSSEIFGPTIKDKSRSNISYSSFTEADKLTVSKSIGYVGIVILTLEIVVTILIDLPKIVSDCQIGYGNVTGKNHNGRKVKKMKKNNMKKDNKPPNNKLDNGNDAIQRSKPFDILVEEMDM